MAGPRLKRFVEEIFREALSRVDSEELVRQSLLLRENSVVIRGVPYPLHPQSKLVLLAIGKAAIPMARGALAVLRARVTRCLVVTKVREGNSDLGDCTVLTGDHPIPDAQSLLAGQAALEAVQGLRSQDLVLVLLSGGGSALVEVPRPPLLLEDIARTTDRLLRAGADIWFLNAVRRRLSVLKGGGLAQAAAPARIVNLIVSDVLGNPVPVIASGPTVTPARSSYDIPTVLTQMGVWEELPPRVRDCLECPEPELPPFDHVLQTIVLADAAQLARAASEACQRRGLPAVLLGTRFTGEAREFGRFWATLARSVREERLPWAPPVAIVAAGELTVTVRGEGRGGRNTEMALAAALLLSGTEGITVASLASDGDDGTSGAAGAVVDGLTAQELRSLGIDAMHALVTNDSATALARVDALVHTGLTGSNVNDLYLALIERSL